MKNTFTVLFYIRKDKQKKNGNSPIHCRITHNGKSTQFNTKAEIQFDQWDSSTGRAIGRSAANLEINALLDNSKASLFRIYHELQEKGKSITSELIKNIFFGKDKKYHTLLQVFTKHNKDFEDLVGNSKSGKTLEKYKRTMCLLEEYIKCDYELSDISLNDIDHRFVKQFEKYMQVNYHYHQNTIGKNMRRFKTIIIYAKNNNWLDHDPFGNYQISFVRSDRGYLTQKEIEAIMQKEFRSKRLEQVRDIFIFSCYTGLAYIDVKNLEEKNIRTSFDGKLWIMTKRQKTSIQSNIPLLDIAKQILDKYAGTLPDQKVLPILTNQKMNAYLKEIADVCGIDKNLTFHLARHTFATSVTLSKGVPIETVSKMLGHTNIKTTQIYARITDSKVGNDMEILAEKLNGNTVSTYPIQNPSKALQIDRQFECLSLGEKMNLFGLPKTLSHSDEREKRINDLWHNLSESEKASLWLEFFKEDKKQKNTDLLKVRLA